MKFFRWDRPIDHRFCDNTSSLEFVTNRDITTTDTREPSELLPLESQIGQPAPCALRSDFPPMRTVRPGDDVVCDD